jgi:hypothetical protein
VWEMPSIMLLTSEVDGRSFTCSCSTFSSSITCAKGGKQKINTETKCQYIGV